MINAISSNNFQVKSSKKDISMTSNVQKTVLREAVKVAIETPKTKIPASKKISMNFRKVTDWLLDYRIKHVYDEKGNLSEIIHTTNSGHTKEITSYKNGKKIGLELRDLIVDNKGEKISKQIFYNFDNEQGRLTKLIRHYDKAKIDGKEITKMEIDYNKTYRKKDEPWNEELCYKQKLTDVNGKEYISLIGKEAAISLCI